MKIPLLHLHSPSSLHKLPKSRSKLLLLLNFKSFRLFFLFIIQETPIHPLNRFPNYLPLCSTQRRWMIICGTEKGNTQTTPGNNYLGKSSWGIKVKDRKSWSSSYFLIFLHQSARAHSKTFTSRGKHLMATEWEDEQGSSHETEYRRRTICDRQR